MTTQQKDFWTLICDFCLRHNHCVFTNQQLLGDSDFMSGLADISHSKTLDRQLSFLLQKVRDAGLLTFVDYKGTYSLV